MALDNQNTPSRVNSSSWQDREIVTPQVLSDPNALELTTDNSVRFSLPMFQAALEFYALPVNYIRNFKRHPIVDKTTRLPLLNQDGKPKMTLQACNVVQACIKEQVAIWTQVNEPFEGTAIWTSEDGRFSYPKKAKNSDIQFIRNVVLDAEYPSNPSIAHKIAQQLIDYLASQGIVKPDHPIEDSGAGFHIGLPIVPIEIPANSPPETALLLNGAVSDVVNLYIKSTFKRLCRYIGVSMDLEGFDISRILSLPGTWRPHNPDKNDCQFLQQGYLRRWLPPYTDGKYPIREESLKLTSLIQSAFEELQQEIPKAINYGKEHFLSYPSLTSNALCDDDLIGRAMNGAKFTTLWFGDTSAYDDDRSDADLALCNHLAFWTGKDPQRMDRLFRQSGLMRDKWNRGARTGETYGQGTIRVAIANCKRVYDPLYYQHQRHAELDNFLASTHKREHSIEENITDRERGDNNTEKVPIAKEHADQSAQATPSFEKIQLEIDTAIEQQNVDALYALTKEIAVFPLKERTMLASSVKKRIPTFKSDCTFSWATFKRLVEQEVKAHELYKSANVQQNASPYEKTSHGMLRHTVKGETLLISNFSAEIIADRVNDDGAMRTRSYAMSAKLFDHSYHFEIPAENFNECKWIDTYIGAKACINVGPSMRWHLIAAIKCCSNPQEQINYAHTGWRKINGHMVYLHNGGYLSQVQDQPGQITQTSSHRESASGATSCYNQPAMSQVSQESQSPREIGVILAGSLSSYMFPTQRTNQQQAIRASLKFVDLTNDTITMPLYAALWRTSLGTIDFGVHLSGQTGMGKSEITALLQQHFGVSMHARNFPGSWESTENSLEMLLFQAKDTLVVIDDFKPKGNKYDQERMHAKADRIFRSLGNGSTRARLNGDLQQRPERRPRCMVLSTGEDVPKGESLKARSLVLSMDTYITKGDASKRLSSAQHDARDGWYAQAMAGYIEWLAPQIEQMQATLSSLVALERDLLQQEGHARSNTNTANLILGMKCFLAYAYEMDAITSQEKDSYLERCKLALADLASEAAYENKEERPSEQWKRLVIAALTSKNAHLVTFTGGNPGLEYGWEKSTTTNCSGESLFETVHERPSGLQIGWIDGEDIYLSPIATYTIIREIGTKIGDTLTILEPTLRKFLAQDQVLASTSLDEKKRSTVTIRKRLQGLQRDVLHIKEETLFPNVSLPECLDSLDFLDSTPAKPASEEASGVSQVIDLDGPESSELTDSTQLRNSAGMLDVDDD